MLTLTEEQRRRYESTRQMASNELERFDKELADEILRARQRIEELQQAKQAMKQIHDSACTLLGIKSAVTLKDHGIADLERPA
jgi:hypothetical protein